MRKALQLFAVVAISLAPALSQAEVLCGCYRTWSGLYLFLGQVSGIDTTDAYFMCAIVNGNGGGTPIISSCQFR